VCDLSAKIFGVSDGLAKNIEGLITSYLDASKILK